MDLIHFSFFHSIAIRARKIGTGAKAKMDMTIKITAAFAENHKHGTLAMNKMMLAILVYANQRCDRK